MFRKIFYGVTIFVVFVQVYAIFSNLFFLNGVHGSIIWERAPITVLCLGILAIIEAIDKRKD